MERARQELSKMKLQLEALTVSFEEEKTRCVCRLSTTVTASGETLFLYIRFSEASRRHKIQQEEWKKGALALQSQCAENVKV